MKLSKKHIQHLFLRAGFGIQPSDLQSIQKLSQEKIVDGLFKSSEKYDALTIDLSALEKDRKKLSKEEKKELRKLTNKKMLELNLEWLKRMTETEAVLREKITFFFHDHFAVRIKSPKANIHLNNIIREHALGDFGTMLMKVSKSPAMISFLNNIQNKKSNPNEKFAREVMELFTLGRDNGYTEVDIQEAARAFTGWSYDKDGKFVFRANVHDTDEKTILGQSGNFKGEDVIRILLEQKQTARYITRKLLDFLISRPLTDERLEHFTGIFFESNYKLETLIRAVLLSTDFNANESIGSRIKSPTELIVGISKQFKIDYKNPKAVLQLQKKLNQVLFFPPNVAGWQNGKGWIDSSTLMIRMKMPSILLNFGVIEWDDSPDTAEEANAAILKRRAKTKSKIEKRFQAYPDWDYFEKEIKTEKDRLVDYLIQPQLSQGAMATIAHSADASIQERVIEILSLPEYQLC
jgi:uncharacterized protein (DUF1800 family)